MTGTESFGRWLRRCRKGLDLTQKELAQQAGCSTATIRKLEADELRPSKQLAALLADCLRIAPADQAAFVAFARTEGTADGPLPQPASSPPWSGPRLINLPAPLTRLIGRAQDVAAVRNYLLQAEARLLTLTGPPGIGKTRLAIQVATELANAFADGITFVDLAPLRKPDLVLPTIARTLSLQETSQQSLSEQLISTFQNKAMLLVLDNFEHLLSAVPLVMNLLEHCPTLKILSTSRESLNIRAERQFPVLPLLLPNLADLPEAELLAGYPAVELFVTRAQAVNPALTLTGQNAADIAAICARLDGLPLAIELAASRVKLLPLSELAERLNQRLTLLTEGQRDMPPRHRALRAAIDWSFELLQPWEQTLLTRLAVFGDGCTLDAAEAVVVGPGMETGPGVETGQVLDGLASLVNKSLLQQREAVTGRAWFSMLDMIREYAWERLERRGESETVRRRHAAYYLALVEQAEPELRGPQQKGWLDRLEAEVNNVRAALEWLLSNQASDEALRLGGALWRFWELHGHLSEGRAWLAAVLEQSSQAPLSETPVQLKARAKALLGAGKLAEDQGDWAVARTSYEESLALWQALGDEAGRAGVLHHLGLLAQATNDYGRAEALHRQCLALSQTLHDRVGIYISLYNLAEIALINGDYEQAERLHEESLALKREQNDTWSIAWSLDGLAKLAFQRGDTDRAANLYRASLELRLQLNDKAGLAESLAGLARVIWPEQPAAAARLLGAVDRVFTEINYTLAAAHAYHQAAANLQARLEQATFEAAWRAGQALPLEEIIQEALGPDAAPLQHHFE